MGTFRFKSDLRNHQAIVQPRLYDCLMVTRLCDCLMVTQITLTGTLTTRVWTRALSARRRQRGQAPGFTQAK